MLSIDLNTCDFVARAGIQCKNDHIGELNSCGKADLYCECIARDGLTICT